MSALELISEDPGTAPTILVVEDDPATRRLVQASLEPEGFSVALAEDAAAAERWISGHGLPHLAVVDIGLPDGSGLDLCREVQTFADLAVVMITADSREETLVEAIDQVAEDYIVKPVKPRELAARVKRVLRRLGSGGWTHGREVVVDDHLTLLLAEKTARVDGDEVSLTPTETKLLHVLARQPRRTVSTGFLLQRLWPLEEIYEDTLRVHVHRLRRKIEPDPSRPSYLITQRGRGYSFLPLP